MKKTLKILIIFLIILLAIITILSIAKSKKNPISDTETKEISAYIKDIYNIHYSIPEFSNINEADIFWICDNVNQYLSNHSEFEERNQNRRLYL